MQKVVDNPAVRDSFYEELSSAVTAPSRFQVFVCGDFNSKLGQRTPEDEEAGLSCCLGAHGKGIRNSNGEALIQFLLHHGLFASNTAFEHASRHKTSWMGKRPKCPSTLYNPVYNQIDYVLCKTSAKSLLSNARSYGGATLSSDHKPVRSGLPTVYLCPIGKARSYEFQILV